MVMVGFTLSKINLLIFVTAMFVIIVYFTFGFSDVLLKQQTSQMVNRYANEAVGLINSKSFCVQNTITFPSAISYLGDQRIFYLLKIEKVESQDITRPNNLIFSIFSRKEPTKVLASRRIDTFAKIHFFNQNPEGSFQSDTALVLIDPQSAPSILDSLFIAKETFNGQDYVYLTNCSSTTAGGCSENIAKVGDSIIRSDAVLRNNVSLCVPFHEA